MPANYYRTRCVYARPLVPVCVGISIQKPVNSHLDKTITVALKKKWSWPIFNEQDIIMKLKAFTIKTDRRKMTASVLMGFVLLATLCWSNGLLLQLLSLSRAASISRWRRFQTWQIEKRTRWFERRLFTGERFHCNWNLGRWVVATSQSNHSCCTTFPRKLLSQTITYRTPTPRRNQKKRNPIWLRSMQHWSTQKFESKLF